MELNVRLIIVSMLTVVVAVVAYVLSLNMQYYFCSVGMLNVGHAVVHYIISSVTMSVPLLIYGNWLFME